MFFINHSCGKIENYVLYLILTQGIITVQKSLFGKLIKTHRYTYIFNKI